MGIALSFVAETESETDGTVVASRACGYVINDARLRVVSDVLTEFLGVQEL